MHKILRTVIGMVRVALAAPDPYPGKVAAISDVQKTKEQKTPTTTATDTPGRSLCTQQKREKVLVVQGRRYTFAHVQSPEASGKACRQVQTQTL